MRYYFAIQSYFDTQKAPIKTRYKTRISHWFNLTENHHMQLYELDKKDYLKNKNMEHLDQIRLQKEINENESITRPVTSTDCVVVDDVY